MTWAALGTASSAFIVDLMPPEQRGWGMWAFINAPRRWAGYWGAALIGGLLADSVGFSLCFLVAPCWQRSEYHLFCYILRSRARLQSSLSSS
jgi:hypothetical protein